MKVLAEIPCDDFGPRGDTLCVVTFDDPERIEIQCREGGSECSTVLGPKGIAELLVALEPYRQSRV